MKIQHILQVSFGALVLFGTSSIAHQLHDWVKISDYNNHTTKLDAKIKAYETSLKKPLDLDVRNDQGQTPLMIAAQKGHDQIVIYLLEHKVDPSIIDKQGNTAFDYASQDMIKAALIKRSHNKNGETLLTQTIKNDDVKHFKELIGRKDLEVNQPNKAGQTPLHCAVLVNNRDMVDKLLACTIQLDVQDQLGNTPLHYACQMGNVEMVIDITNAGAKPDILNKSHKAPIDVIGNANKQATKNEKQAIKHHLESIKTHPVNIKKTKQHCAANTPATAASECTAHSMDPHCVKVAKAHNESVKNQEKEALEQFDENGQTLLTNAVCEGSFENVNKILEIGASVNASDKQGNTPLIIAIKCASKQMDARKYFKIIDLLLAKGANILLHDQDGKNPLHYAVEYENRPLVDMLLKSLAGNQNKKEIVNAQDKNGDTPLHYAAATSNLKLVKDLLMHGADREVPNNVGKYARDVLGTKQSTSEKARKEKDAYSKDLRKHLGLEVEGISGSGTATAKPLTKPSASANPEASLSEPVDEWNAQRMGRARTSSIYEAPTIKK